MTAYVWQRVDQVSDNHHSGGGLLVVATDDDRARHLIAADPDVVVTDVEWLSVIRIACDDAEPERLIVFPDAGCC